MTVGTDVGRDVSLSGVLEDLLARLARGDPLDREAVLAEHPELAAELGPCLTALDLMHRADADGARGEEPGRGRIGDFAIVREIGRGGMGVVYEAEQVSLRRRVALKILPFASTLDPRQLQRFHNEALAAAQLHHTHIVPVYSVGCDRGVHYYAMQYVEGASVADLIAELRERVDAAPGGTEGRAASSGSLRAVTQGCSVASAGYCRSVARLGVQAAEALHHAHEQGVVHRDVKPANLLVDGAGELWVTDFGLASFRSAEGLTVTGDLVGTVRYMSPEQTRGQHVLVDQRTDVYSLGVTLYELLTLEHAVVGRDTHEVMRSIVHREAVDPRRRNAAVPVELATIVEKAMAKRPEDRYATAREMADDLVRHLEDRPIEARRPGWGGRLAKWARRHRPVVAAGLVALAVAVFALGVANFAIARERDDAVRARRHVADTLGQLGRVSEGLLADVGETIATDADLAPRLRPLLATLVDGYRVALDGLSEEPHLAGQVARGHRTLGRILTACGRYDEAEVELARAEALLLPLGDADHGLGSQRGEREALARERHALDLTRRQWSEWEGVLRGVVAAQERWPGGALPAPDDAPPVLGWAALGHFLASTGRTEAAIRAYASALEILEAAKAAEPTCRDVRRSLAWVHEQAGLLHLERGDVPGLIARLHADEIWDVVNDRADLEQAVGHLWDANEEWTWFRAQDPADPDALRGYWRTYCQVLRLFWKTRTGAVPGAVHPDLLGQVECAFDALEPIPPDAHPVAAGPRPFRARAVFYGLAYEPPYARWKVRGHATGAGPASGEAQANLTVLPGGGCTITMALRLASEGGDAIEVITYGGEPTPPDAPEVARVAFAVVGGTGVYAGAEGHGVGRVYDILPLEHPSQAGLRLELEGQIQLR